jgi:hypothetical protein
MAKAQARARIVYGQEQPAEVDIRYREVLSMMNEPAPGGGRVADRMMMAIISETEAKLNDGPEWVRRLRGGL